MKIDRTDYEHTSGNTGEKIVYDWLISRGNEVEDVTLNQSYQKTDVDFVVNNSYKIEVKVDQKIEQTGNVYVELGYSQEDWNHKGWIDYCGADECCNSSIFDSQFPLNQTAPEDFFSRTDDDE